MPEDPRPIRIERFIKKRFGVEPIYESLPKDVLGFTCFGKDGVESIYISAELADEGTKAADRRVITTLAHEAGHCLLHTHLFALEALNLSLFNHDPDVTPAKILCRDEVRDPVLPSGRGYDGRWWEYQANKAIGGLLLPKPLVERCLEPFLVQAGTFGRVTLNQAKRTEAARIVAETFEVNPVVARIRLAGMFPEEEGRQLTL